MRGDVLFRGMDVEGGRNRIRSFAAAIGSPMIAYRILDEISEDAQDASTLLVCALFAIAGSLLYALM